MKKLEDTSNSDDVIITANTIHRATGNLKSISRVVPKMCERFIVFVNENMSIVGADTASHLLFYLFSLGFDPFKNLDTTQLITSGNHPSFSAQPFDFNNFTRIINRDFELMPAWLIVRACLALSFYQALTLDLIHRVFNIEFFMRLEKELSYDSVMYSFTADLMRRLSKKATNLASFSSAHLEKQPKDGFRFNNASESGCLP